jgi:NhaA family Na+:H+ antiporter
MLPTVSALGGVIFPVLVYIGVTHGHKSLANGWAIPAATDIAFALALLGLAGSRVPPALKTCLLAIAIIDDLAAILMIAFFYTQNFAAEYLLFALPVLAGLFFLNRARAPTVLWYLLLGLILWVLVLKSGVHATLAGVLCAFFVPLTKRTTQKPFLTVLEKKLAPWSSFLILPLFAFANAGISLEGIKIGSFTHPLVLGIGLGLFLGKQLGVVFFAKIGVSLGICELPSQTSWRDFYGMALLTGVGFTMSLFIGMLAFQEEGLMTYTRMGVLLGSFASAALGVWVLVRKE